MHWIELHALKSYFSNNLTRTTCIIKFINIYLFFQYFHFYIIICTTNETIWSWITIFFYIHLPQDLYIHTHTPSLKQTKKQNFVHWVDAYMQAMWIFWTIHWISLTQVLWFVFIQHWVDWLNACRVIILHYALSWLVACKSCNHFALCTELIG